MKKVMKVMKAMKAMKVRKFALAALPLMPVSAAFAEEGGGLGEGAWVAIKAVFYFLAVAIAAAAGTTAQSKAASAALEGIARNPSAADKIMTPMILGLALMESLVIFTLITVFLI